MLVGFALLGFWPCFLSSLSTYRPLFSSLLCNEDSMYIVTDKVYYLLNNIFINFNDLYLKDATLCSRYIMFSNRHYQQPLKAHCWTWSPRIALRMEILTW